MTMIYDYYCDKFTTYVKNRVIYGFNGCFEAQDKIKIILIITIVNI